MAKHPYPRRRRPHESRDHAIVRNRQQAQHLPEKRKVDAGTGAHDRAAELNFNRRGAGIGAMLREHWDKIRFRTPGVSDHSRPKFPPSAIELVAMQPVAQRDRARHCPGTKLSATIAAFSAALQRRRHGVPVSTSTRRKLCPSIGKLHGKPTSLPRSREAGSPDYRQAAQGGDSASLNAASGVATRWCREGGKLIRNLARGLEREAPGVSPSILEGIGEILTDTRLGLPLELRRSLACTNIIENMNGTIRHLCAGSGPPCWRKPRAPAAQGPQPDPARRPGCPSSQTRRQPAS